MQELSRRTVLIAATALAAVPAGRATAATAPRSLPPTLSGQLGPLKVAITTQAGMDAAGFRLVIVNTGTVTETITLFATDQNTGRETRHRTVMLPAGKTRVQSLYGHLKHSITVTVCRADATCLQLGPIGPRTAVAPRRGPQGFHLPPVVPQQAPGPTSR